MTARSQRSGRSGMTVTAGHRAAPFGRTGTMTGNVGTGAIAVAWCGGATVTAGSAENRIKIDGHLAINMVVEEKTGTIAGTRSVAVSAVVLRSTEGGVIAVTGHALEHP